MRSSFDLELVKSDDVFSAAEVDALFRIHVGEVQDTGGGCVAYVTLLVQINITNQVVSELMVGIANSENEAVVYAVHDLVETVVSPIVAIPCEGLDLQTSDECAELTYGEQKWLALQGRILSNDTDGSLTALLDENPPLLMISKVLSEVMEKDSQFHWIKIYYANFGDRAVGEVRIDNEVHAESSNHIESLPFPTERPLMFRQFLTFVPIK